ERSSLLPAGLDARLTRLGAALRTALASADAVPDPDAPLVADTAGVESAWTVVAEHRLADADPRTGSAGSAVRLVRWLAAPVAAEDTGIAALTTRHVIADAWVDAAMDDVGAGAVDHDLAAALNALAAVVRRRRNAHDRAFAAALAAHTADDRPGDVRHVEDVLPDVVLRLARSIGVLLLVCDGMSVAVSTEVVAAAVKEGWQEALLADETGRASALAVLPSLTDPSRTSLLAGNLRTGQRALEIRAHAELTRAAGLPGEPALFHKGPLDSSRLGYAVADDVGAALDDLDRRPLVTCVLNAVDDALDRSDPGGTVWGLDTVKHLRPLLDRARRAGRVVVLTADHGHIVERRQGAQRRHAGASSGRSRPADVGPVEDDEVLVAGRRVLTPDGRAVLAVDDGLRYGPLKAGYHGGASPAEVVVPLVVLVPGGLPERTDLRLATPQEPEWWDGPVTPGPAPAELPPAPPGARPAPPATPTLFDEPEPERPSPPQGAAGVVASVLRSPVYAEQKAVSGRLAVTDEQVGRMLSALLIAPDQRLAPARAAVALGVPVAALRGALLHVSRVLNVEGYAVLQFDADGITVVLDEPLLREQFGLGT
ncbi:MAG: BREX-2 system phosphatase PglZ, partial [Actinomycetota bacterium]|nr:BREX-2 system phosphatase PglZ [Actinomycetota bacterium]